MSVVKKKKKKNKTGGYLAKVFLSALGIVLLIGGIVLAGLSAAGRISLKENLANQEQGVPVEKFPGQNQTLQQEETSIPEGKYGKLLADEERMKRENVYVKKAKDQDRVTMVFGGDILLDPNYAIMANALRRESGLIDSFSEEVRQILGNADISMLNNEFPYSLRGTPLPEKAFTFRAKPEYAGYLAELGVDVVSLANNHAYDYGEEALLDSFDALDGADVRYVGAGKNWDRASEPLYFIANDMKIAIVSATQIERLDHPDTKEATESAPGVFRCWNPEKLYRVVAEAKSKSDFVIVYIHWGTENQEEVDWAQREQAPKIAEAGADLIVGDHPHLLQKLEYVKDVPVIYSLGNFLFNSKPLDTALIRITLTEEGLEQLELIPCRQEDSKVRVMTEEEGIGLIDHMNQISPGVFVGTDGIVQKLE